MRAMFVLFSVCCFATCSLAQQEPPQPSGEHQLLKKEVGTWSGTMKFYPSPDAEPFESQCTEVNTMLKGDLWLITRFEAGPFHGHGQFGYDTDKSKFVGSWVDNMNTNLGVMYGDANLETGELTMFSKGKDAASGQWQDTKTVTSWDGDDKRVFTMYMKSGEQWNKSLEIRYHRDTKP